MKLKHSRWVHRYQSEASQYLFHSTRLDVLEVDAELLTFFDRFASATDLDSALVEQPDPAAGRETALALRELGFLVPDDANEAAEFEHQRSASIDRQGVGRVASFRILLTEACNLRCTVTPRLDPS